MNTYLSFVFVLVVGLSVLAASPAGAEAASSWAARPTGVVKEWSGIDCPEARVCYLVSGVYLVGGTGAAVKTKDGGETFTLLTLPTSDPLHAISCPTAALCYAAGDFGAFIKTEDGGATWSELTLGTKANRPQLTALFAVNESRVIIVGRDAVMYRTEDGGKHFVRVSLRTTADLYDVYFTSASAGFASGNDGALLKTTDGGATWVLQRSLRDAGLIADLHGAAGGVLFAVGDFVHTSVDGGATWTKAAPSGVGSHRAVAVLDERTAYRTEFNHIFKTLDSGATWHAEMSAVNSIFTDIACPAADYCLAVGVGGIVLRLGAPPEPPLPPPPPPPALSAEPPATLSPATTSSLAAPVENAPPVEEPKKEVIETPKPQSVIKKTAGVFTRSLRRGARGADVRKLQEMLAGIGGIYPEGTVSGFFGPATAQAVRRFQERYGIAVPGEEGYGEAGPKTRAKLIEAASGEITPQSPKQQAEPSRAEPIPFKRTLKKGARGDDVKRLQKILTADTGLYPEGETTGYFGAATWKAVGRFQEKHGLAEPGEEGYGIVGPKTRAKLTQMGETE